MKGLFCIVTAAVTLQVSLPTFAYEAETTHRTLSGIAIDRSELATDPELLPMLGFLPYGQDEFFLPLDNGFEELTLKEVFQLGAVAEDHVGLTEVRVIHHFFDPQNNRGLTVNTTEFESSPDWALEDIGDGETGPDQLNSYRDARQSYLRSLTSTSPNDRKRFFAETIKSLGHVAHHIQDLAQPQHARNDVHCSSRIFCDWLLEALSDQAYYRPSAYEEYVGDQNARLLSGDIATTSYPVASVSTSEQFLTPRDFWANPRIPLGGMAEFTSANFPTDHTMIRWNPAQSRFVPHPEFPLPGNGGLTYQFTPCELEGSLGSKAGVCGNVLATITDSVSGQTQQQPIASLTPIWSTLVSYLLAHGGADQAVGGLFEVNEAIYESRFRMLAPRLVAFSAGLIDYFFRGHVELVFDPDYPNYWVRIKNSGDEILSGKFSLYAEDEDGFRSRLSDSGWADRTLFLQAGQTSNPIPFNPDAHVARYALTFEGRMGLEGHSSYNSLTAVAGSVKDIDRVTVRFGDYSELLDDVFGVHVFSAATNDRSSQLLHSESSGTPKTSVEFSLRLAPGRYLVELVWLNPVFDPTVDQGTYQIEFSSNVNVESSFPLYGHLVGGTPKAWWYITVPYTN